MNLGQRIALKRKELGLSQEALGERLGVSRQSIYKWESGAALPEIEKLIALSRIFAVPVGWLLGVEEDFSAAGQDSAPENTANGELTEAQLRMVEEIVRRYQDARPTPPKRKKWPWVLAALALVILFSVLFEKLDDLENNYSNIQRSVQNINQDVSWQINSITSRVEDVLNGINNFTVEHSAEILDADLAKDTVTLGLEAIPKTYVEGMEAIFTADYGDGVAEVPASYDGRSFSARLTCPLSDELSAAVTFIHGDTRETQAMESWHQLRLATFPVEYIHSAPFDFMLNHENVLTQGAIIDLHYSGYEKEGLPQSEISEVRAGLFEDHKLVHWLPFSETGPQDVEHENTWFFVNPTNYAVKTDGTEYNIAVVVTDNYGRELVFCDIGSYYADGDWNYADRWDSVSMPEDWEY